MTVIASPPSLARRLAGPDRRRPGAQFRQHRIRPRLSLAREPSPRGSACRPNGSSTRRRCRPKTPTGSGSRFPNAPDLAADLLDPGDRPARGDSRHRRRARSSREAARGFARRIFPLFTRDASPGRRLPPGVLSCRWRWSVRDAPVEAALGPIALAAVKLFTEGDFHRIRECGGHACGWLFYDRSKNNRRRWCEMEVCGNRAKQRRLAARRRGGLNRRLVFRLIILLAAAMLAGCSPALETDQARLCRMALPALMPEAARDRHSGAKTRRRRARLERRLQRADGRRRAGQSFRRLPLSRAGTAERVARSGVGDDRRPAADANPALRPHPLLAGDAGGPGRRSCAARRRQRPPPRAAPSRLRVADGARRAAAGGDLRAPGGGLFADLRPDRADQFRLRRNGRGRRLRGGDRGFGDGRLAARPAPDRGLRARRRGRGGMGLRRGARRCSFRSAMLAASRCWWRRSAWRSSCANSCAWRRATGAG